MNNFIDPNVSNASQRNQLKAGNIYARKNGAVQIVLALLLLTGGCVRVQMIPLNAEPVAVRAGETFQAPVDGVFMTDYRHQKFRTAESNAPPPPRWVRPPWPGPQHLQ